MNRGKKSFDKKTQKKLNKTVRLAQNSPATLAKSVVLPQPVIAQQMGRPPVPAAEKDRVLIRAAKRAQAEKTEVKKFHKISKRTTPGKVPIRDSAPHVVHVEGKRWIKTLEEQSTSQSKILTKRLSKKKLPLRKKGIPFK